jgi:hypothetical protein
MFNAKGQAAVEIFIMLIRTHSSGDCHGEEGQEGEEEG